MPLRRRLKATRAARTFSCTPIATAAPFVARSFSTVHPRPIYQNAPYAPLATGNMDAGGLTPATMWLGCGPTAGANLFNGSLVEVLVYNSVLSAEQLTRVFEYLKNKYAVAAVELTFTSPKNLQGCQMWLDAAHVTLGTPPAVASMQDQSGNGNDAAQATVGDRPTLVTNAINGLPAVNFATGQWLVHPLSAQVAPFSVWAVAAAGEPAAGQFQTLYGNDSGVTFATQTGNAADPWGIYLNGAETSASFITSPGANVYHSITCTVVNASGAVTFSTDGTIATATGGGAYTGSAGVLGGGSTSQPWDGPMAELATWSRVLTLPEIALLETYSKAKYALEYPFTPPDIGGCELWLRADLGVSYGTPPAVSGWADQSGAGHDVAQATALNRPTHVASDPTFGGQASLAFAQAAAQYLASATWGASLSTAYSVLVVGHIVATGVADCSLFDDLKRGAERQHHLGSGNAVAPLLRFHGYSGRECYLSHHRGHARNRERLLYDDRSERDGQASASGSVNAANGYCDRFARRRRFGNGHPQRRDRRSMRVGPRPHGRGKDATQCLPLKRYGAGFSV